MISSLFGPILPFWILGVALIVGVMSWLRMPRQDQLASQDRRASHR